MPISAKKYGEKYYYYGDDKNKTEHRTRSTNINLDNELPNLNENMKKVQQLENTAKTKIDAREVDDNGISKEEKEDILNQINKYLEQEKKK